MPTSVGPNTFGEENLVFGYDTGDVNNSYRGEPTTNLVTDTPAGNGWAGDYTVVDSSTKTFTIQSKQNNAATTSAWRTHYWSVSSYSGSYVTISADVEFVSETDCTFRDLHIGQGNTGSYPYHIAGSDSADKVKLDVKPITKVHMTWSGVINATGIVGFTQWINNVTANGANSVLKVSNVQIEAKSHATPFTAGSRSADSGSLIDLTGNSTIDLTNVSFDSNAQMTFDGSDDYVEIPTGVINGTGDFTIETVIQADASETGGTVFGNYPSGNLQVFFGQNFIGMYLANNSTYLGASPWNTVLSEFTTSPVHIIAKRSGIVTSFYINGVLKKTGSSSSTIGSTSAAFRVGTNTNTTEQFNGDIFLTKIYNRALTAQEIKANYNGIKGRFNI